MLAVGTEPFGSRLALCGHCRSELCCPWESTGLGGQASSWLHLSGESFSQQWPAQTCAVWPCTVTSPKTYLSAEGLVLREAQALWLFRCPVLPVLPITLFAPYVKAPLRGTKTSALGAAWMMLYPTALVLKSLWIE